VEKREVDVSSMAMMNDVVEAMGVGAGDLLHQLAWHWPSPGWCRPDMARRANADTGSIGVIPRWHIQGGGRPHMSHCTASLGPLRIAPKLSSSQAPAAEHFGAPNSFERSACHDSGSSTVV
jgi:hypothetical protein